MEKIKLLWQKAGLSAVSIKKLYDNAKEEYTGTLWEEADILTKKPTGRFRCFYHVGTRLVDPENAIKALKSLVPYLAILRRAFFSVCW